MADWIKSRKQSDGSFAIVVTREVVGAIIEDFITRATPLEFANAILRAHGIEPAHVFAASAMTAVSQSRGEYDPRPKIDTPPGSLDALRVERSAHHAHDAPMPPHALAIAQHEEAIRRELEMDPERDDDEGAPGEPPRCKTGDCE